MRIERINSKNVVSATLLSSNVGDIFYAKPSRITGIGIILEITRLTETQVVCKKLGIWFPVFDETVFGKIDKASDPERFDYICDFHNDRMEREYRFRKTGVEHTGAANKYNTVDIIDTNEIETLTWEH